MYFLLGFIIGQTIAIVWLLLTIKDLINEIKRYQYTNNLKLIGFIKKLAKIKGGDYVNKRNTF